MSTGGIQVLLGDVKPKSRNGSQRTIAMICLLFWLRAESCRLTALSFQTVLLGLRVLRVDHFSILHVRSFSASRTSRTLRTFRTLRTLSLVKLLRHRVRRALQIVG